MYIKTLVMRKTAPTLPCTVCNSIKAIKIIIKELESGVNIQINKCTFCGYQHKTIEEILGVKNKN